ncbi:MAG: endo-1,4-beta-xylanase [Oscillospiraceae bacterium]|nr:endo-1,4-beta-xylanase [Oscillospiraceae bacterium]
MKRRLLTLTVAIVMLLTLMPIFTMVSAEAEKITEVFINFEDGSLGGFEPRGIGDGLVNLTITDEESHSGNYSLLVSDLQETWFSPGLQVAEYIIPDTWYEFTIWVKAKTTEPTFFSLETQMLALNSADEWPTAYPFSSDETGIRTHDEGWIERKERFYYDSTLYDLDNVTVYVQTMNITDEFYIDSVSFKIADLDQNLKNAARLPSLWETYEDYFMIGNLTDTYPYNPHNGTIDFYKRHFNILKVMGSLAWTESFMPERWVYDFTKADKELEILDPDDFVLLFPSVIYRMHNPTWMARNDDGTLLTRVEAAGNMERLINDVSEKYAGRFPIWEIVGEPRSNLWNESGWWIEGDGHRASWYQAFDNGANRSAGEFGGDYVEYAFRFARAANPSSKLYLSDQAEEYERVANNVADLVKGINDKWLAEGNDRLLIEGIVMQGHYSLDTPLEDIERTLKLFADLGVSVSFGELDLRLFDIGTAGEPTQELFEKQAEMYARLFLMFKEYANTIEHVTFWGVADITSWLNYVSPNGFVQLPKYPQYPLLFDNDFLPKLAYFAVIDPEGYLAGDFDTEEKRMAWLEANMLPEPDPTPAPAPTPNNDPQTPLDPTPTPTVTPDPNVTPPQDDPVIDKSSNMTLWIALGVGGTVAIAVVVVLIIKKKR